MKVTPSGKVGSLSPEDTNTLGCGTGTGGGKEEEAARQEPLVLPIREGGLKGHPSCQEDSGGWEASTHYIREEGYRQGLSPNR